MAALQDVSRSSLARLEELETLVSRATVSREHTEAEEVLAELGVALAREAQALAARVDVAEAALRQDLEVRLLCVLGGVPLFGAEYVNHAHSFSGYIILFSFLLLFLTASLVYLPYPDLKGSWACRGQHLCAQGGSAGAEDAIFRGNKSGT